MAKLHPVLSLSAPSSSCRWRLPGAAVLSARTVPAPPPPLDMPSPPPRVVETADAEPPSPGTLVDAPAGGAPSSRRPPTARRRRRSRIRRSRNRRPPAPVTEMLLRRPSRPSRSPRCRRRRRNASRARAGDPRQAGRRQARPQPRRLQSSQQRRQAAVRPGEAICDAGGRSDQAEEPRVRPNTRRQRREHRRSAGGLARTPSRDALRCPRRSPLPTSGHVIP